MGKNSVKILVILLALIFTASVSFAAIEVKDEGTKVGGDAGGLDFTGSARVIVTGDYSEKTVNLPASKTVVVADTPDTLETSESGTTFVATSEAAGGRSFDLPSITAADDDCIFTFINGPSNIVANRTLEIQPQDDACIFFEGRQADGVSIKADVSAASDSYPTITLVAYGGNWYVVDMKGTWATGS